MATPIKQIQVGSTNHNIRGYFYGTCSTADDNPTKVVVCPEFTSDDLVDGTLIAINFEQSLALEYCFPADQLTLNVNSTGDYTIYTLVNGEPSVDIYVVYTGVILFMYSDTAGGWIVTGPSPDKDSLQFLSLPEDDGVTFSNNSGYGTQWSLKRYCICTTDASTAAKSITGVTSGTAALQTGLAIYANFQNANTADNPTLKLGSSSAKNIFYNGVRITTGSEKNLLRGLCLLIYDGTQWHLIPSGGGGGGSDTMVTQEPSNTDYDRPIILAYDSQTNAGVSITNTVKKSSGQTFTYNPSSGNMKVTQINGVTVGTTPKFTDEKVTVTRTTGSAYYPLLASANTATATYTGGARSGDYFRINPSTRAFLAGDTGLNVYCSTAAATAAKTVTLTGFALKAPSTSQGGSEVFVTFSYTNSAASPTLNVNSTGAKPIKYLANGQLVALPSPAFLAANQTFRFWYDGTNWVTTGPRNVTYGSAAPTGGNVGDVYVQTAATTTVQTSGNWKYITRYDGITECWYKGSFNSGTGFSYWGGVTYKDVAGIAFPVTYSSVYNVQMYLDANGANGWISSSGSGVVSTTQTSPIRVFRGADDYAVTGTLYIHVVGVL